MIKKRLWFLALLVVVIIYLMGPRPAKPEFGPVLPGIPSIADSLDQYVKRSESKHKLRPDNQARIIWADDSLKQKTEFALVYLHGFSASQAEGDPVHRTIAKKFGCNLYLSRLAEHGIDTTEALVSIGSQQRKHWKSALNSVIK